MNHTSCIFMLLLLNSFVNSQPTESAKWGYGVLTSIAISLIGFVISGFVIFFQSQTKNSFGGLNVSKILIGFAIGALLGDAAIHLIPEAFSPGSHDHGSERRLLQRIFEEDGEEEEHDHDHEEETVDAGTIRLTSLLLVLGFFAFFVIEKCMAFLEDMNDKTVHPAQNTEVGECPEATDALNQNNTSNNSPTKESALQSKQNKHFEAVQQLSYSQQIFSIDSWKYKPTVGYLNLVSDFLHNIMDGIAVGALFATSASESFSNVTGTVVAIVVHEIAQEIGDTGILLDNKFTSLQALISNGVVNLSALIGCFIGLGVGNMENKNYVYAFVAGNFIYISCCNMVPEIVKETNIKMAIICTCAMIIGFAIMFGILFLEESQEED